MRIGILGSGAVGQALARGLARHGHTVRIGTRKDAVDDLPVGPPAEVAQDAELVFLAVLGTAAVEVAGRVREELRGRSWSTPPIRSSCPRAVPACSSDTPTPSGSRYSGRCRRPTW